MILPTMMEQENVLKGKSPISPASLRVANKADLSGPFPFPSSSQSLESRLGRLKSNRSTLVLSSTSRLRGRSLSFRRRFEISFGRSRRG